VHKPTNSPKEVFHRNFFFFFFFFNNKNVFARDLNTYTSVPESTKIVPVQPIHMQNTSCARGHVATSSGDCRWCSEKLSQKKKHCSGRVDDQCRICLGRLCTYFYTGDANPVNCSPKWSGQRGCGGWGTV
jgi:hypothetical protein